MRRLTAMFCAVITMFGVWMGTKVLGHPPAGQATDCAPNTITPMVSANGFYNLQKFGPYNGLYAFHIDAKFQWTCPPSDVSYAYTCAPCYSVHLYRDLNYQPSVGDLSVTPNYVDMNKPESYFQINSQPSGSCGTGGVHNWSLMCNQLAPGRYAIEIRLGAGDDRRCYTLRTSWQTVVLP